jgi:hypothetical protein
MGMYGRANKKLSTDPIAHMLDSIPEQNNQNSLTPLFCTQPMVFAQTCACLADTLEFGIFWKALK